MVVLVKHCILVWCWDCCLLLCWIFKKSKSIH